MSAGHYVDHPAGCACIASFDLIFSPCVCAGEFVCPFFHFMTADTPMWQMLSAATTLLVIVVTRTFPVFSFDCYFSHTWGLPVNYWDTWDQFPQGWISVKDRSKFLQPLPEGWIARVQGDAEAVFPI